MYIWCCTASVMFIVFCFLCSPVSVILLNIFFSVLFVNLITVLFWRLVSFLRLTPDRHTVFARLPSRPCSGKVFHKVWECFYGNFWLFFAKDVCEIRRWRWTIRSGSQSLLYFIPKVFCQRSRLCASSLHRTHSSMTLWSLVCSLVCSHVGRGRDPTF